MDIILIVLALIVWRRGWRWWVLLPMASLYSTCFLIGFSIGAFEVEFDDQQWLAIAVPLYLVAGLALLAMAVTRHRGMRTPQPSAAAPNFKLP